MNPCRYLLFILLIALFIPGCGNEQKKSAVIIGISSDPESLNPLFSFSGYEIGIAEVLYPSLVQHHWSSDKGILISTPLLAESFEWEKDSTVLRIVLRKDIKWSDGKTLTVADILFSFDLFSDPAVQSRLYGVFRNFKTDENLKVLPESFEILNTHEFRVNFRENTLPTLIDIDVPVLPEHIYGKLQRDKIYYSEKEIKPVTCGPYKLKSWQKDQSIVLEKNSESFLVKDNTPDEIIFRVIPDYNSRITQLQNGEIDLAEDIRVDNVERLKSNKNLRIDIIKAREYDYIGWNNIDPGAYSSSGKIIPNIFFGDPEIRKALTLAVNRFEITSDYLLNYGQVAYSPVSPIFTEAFNNEIQPHSYNPSLAREILKKAGWIDRNGNGIIDKNGREFSLRLNYPSGNPRREFAAVIIKNNLKLIGIEVIPEPLEAAVFFEKMFNRELNSWIAGWSVPIPPDLKSYWYSGLDEAPFNIVSFRNSYADVILDKLEKEKDITAKNELFKEIQYLFYNENPVTFLYWIDNVAVYNRRIKNAEATPLGAIHNMWEWEINE
jgi:peptide/nickel transport system substrate-binding protein